jgi:hypothetical protein
MSLKQMLKSQHATLNEDGNTIVGSAAYLESAKPIVAAPVTEAPPQIDDVLALPSADGDDDGILATLSPSRHLHVTDTLALALRALQTCRTQGHPLDALEQALVDQIAEFRSELKPAAPLSDVTAADGATAICVAVLAGNNLYNCESFGTSSPCVKVYDQTGAHVLTTNTVDSDLNPVFAPADAIAIIDLTDRDGDIKLQCWGGIACNDFMGEVIVSIADALTHAVGGATLSSPLCPRDDDNVKENSAYADKLGSLQLRFTLV